MNRALFVSAVSAMGLAVTGGLRVARAQSNDRNDDNKWDGPGYYAEDLMTYTSDGSQSLYKIGGPFASLDDCNAYLDDYDKSGTTNDITDSYSCQYRDTDPNYAVPSCFLTTACVQYAGLPDDCEELTVMRRFRDSYLCRFEEGRAIVDFYYAIAPGIVSQINRSPDRSCILNGVLSDVRATARHIGRSEPQDAIARYATMVLNLQRRYHV